MSTAESSDPERAVPEIFDVLPDGHLACRVCGALVPTEAPYPRTQWNWHETSNGA